jgi:hypothetical protein
MTSFPPLTALSVFLITFLQRSFVKIIALESLLSYEHVLNLGQKYKTFIKKTFERA